MAGMNNNKVGLSMAKADLGIYYVVDGSGSMSGVKKDVVKGVNELIEDQKSDLKPKETVLLTLTSFDDRPREVYIAEDIRLVKPVSVNDTFLGGGTALLDALGDTLETAQQNEAKRNVVVVYTDGGENASKRYTYQALGDLVEKLTATGRWQFMWLGAEFADFMKDAGRLLGAAAVTSTLNTSKAAVGQTYSNVSETIRYARNLSPVAYADLGERGGLLSAATADANLDWGVETTPLPAQTTTDSTEPPKKRGKKV